MKSVPAKSSTPLAAAARDGGRLSDSGGRQGFALRLSPGEFERRWGSRDQTKDVKRATGEGEEDRERVAGGGQTLSTPVLFLKCKGRLHKIGEK